ncbi:MAG: hypothetical protein ABIH41_01930 [Nanoarchaeota archaeon]
MHDIEYRILSTFKKDPSHLFSTKEIVKEVFSEDYPAILELLSSPDRPAVNDAKQRMGMLHRRVLYHLNKLVTDSILRLAKIEEHGEKCFELALDPGEYVIEKRQRKIVISKPDVPPLAIEAHEQRKIVARYDIDTWISRLNAIMIDPRAVDELSTLYNAVSRLFGYVNDVIHIAHFEHVLERNPVEDVGSFLRRLDIDSKDYNKTISIGIDLSGKTEAALFISFIEHFATINAENTQIIWQVSSKEFSKHKRLFEAVAKVFSEHTIKIQIHNTDLHAQPIIVGRAGVHTFDKENWQTYEGAEQLPFAVTCTQSTLIIDVHRFFTQHTSASEFRELVMKCAKSLLIANTIQRRNANHYFRGLHSLDHSLTHDLYRHSRNIIRLWNYDLDAPNMQHFLDILRSCRSELDEFCHTEEGIYKSCGIPIRFRIAFSSKFSKLDPDQYSFRAYKKSSIHSGKDFLEEPNKTFIERREELVKIFEGADRVRFFRSKDLNAAEVVRELAMIIGNYSLPFFCFDFATRKGNLKITQFI